MGRLTTRRRVVHSSAHGQQTSRSDTLVVEEPLELRVGGQPVNVTMRTPGDDFDLVTGWLVAEGVVRCADDVATASYCPGLDEGGHNTYNVVDVVLTPGIGAQVTARAGYTSSACGVCGAGSLAAVRVGSPYDVHTDEVTIPASLLCALPDRLREAQRVFERTGGLHAAGLFDAAGTLVCAREDVGRHNAVDKVVGWALREGRLPLRGHVLQVSGRASFELVQKAAVAGIPVLSAVSAPSSLAMDLATECGLTLAGFVRGQSFNIYSRPERIVA